MPWFCIKDPPTGSESVLDKQEPFKPQEFASVIMLILEYHTLLFWSLWEAITDITFRYGPEWLGILAVIIFCEIHLSQVNYIGVTLYQNTSPVKMVVVQLPKRLVL